MLRIARNILLPGIKPVFLTLNFLNFTDSILNFSYNSITFFSLSQFHLVLASSEKEGLNKYPHRPVFVSEQTHISVFPRRW